MRLESLALNGIAVLLDHWMVVMVENTDFCAQQWIVFVASIAIEPAYCCRCLALDTQYCSYCNRMKEKP